MHIFWIIVLHFGALGSFMVQTMRRRGREDYERKRNRERKNINESQSVVL